ncbi:MAG: molybdenum cofactor guanylyltransferase [Thermoanaerobaculales bacterium]
MRSGIPLPEPIFGGLLVGGASRRMGRPKATLPFGERKLAEVAADALSASVAEIVLLGAGPVPGSLADNRRLPDPPGLEGPLAGLLAALRWAPHAAWVIAACDLPRVMPEAVAWLIAQRRSGQLAVLPRVGPGFEPLLAIYEPEAGPLLEELVSSGRRAPRLIAAHPAVATPEPPPEIVNCWQNANTLKGLPPA